MSLLLYSSGSSKCRTIDKVDIFGDSSGVALYQLDGNANDTGGNYHGTATAITYGGGAYERGAVSPVNSSITSTLSITFSALTYSFWIKQDASNLRMYLFYSGAYVSTAYSAGVALAFYDGTSVLYTSASAGTTISDSQWHHIVVTWDKSANSGVAKAYIDGVLKTADSTIARLTDLVITNLQLINHTTGGTTAYVDQMRIFNRAITATEVATLYAECAPTSTVSTEKSLLTNEPLAYFKLDGNAQDSMKNYIATAVSPVYTDGKFGQCADFNTLTPTLTIPRNAFLGYPEFTMSFWVKYSSFPADSYIIRNITGGNIYYGGVRQTGNQILANFGLDGTSAQTTSAFTASLNTWHHVCLTYDSSKNVKMYFDGVASTSFVFQYTLANITADFKVFQNNAGRVAGGFLDSIRSYNRVLTQQEVLTLLAESSPVSTVISNDPLNDSSCKAFYRFENDVLDSTGAFPGTVTGGTVTYITGKFGTGAAISGGKIDLGTKTLMPSSSNYSVSGWIKRTTGVRNIVSTRTQTGNIGDDFFWDSNDVIEFSIATSATVQRVWRTAAINKRGDGLFHNIIISVDRQGQASLYLDGDLQVWATSNTTTFSYDNNLNVLIGSYHNVVYTVDAIDHVRFFNKALTATEAQTVYSESRYFSTTLPSIELDPFMDNSCKALYKFDGNSLDSFDKYNGTATNVTYAAGKFGQCAVFNGSSSKVLVNSDMSLNVVTTKTITLNIWMKSTSTAARQTLWHMHSAVDNSSSLTSIENYGFGSTAGITLYQNNASVLVVNNTGLSDGNWHMITVITNNGTTYLYKDGVLIGSVVTAAIVNASSYTSIGNRNYNNDNWFNGSIDQFRFFNKALTPLEVASLYNETTTLEEPMYKLVDPFKDGSGKALYRLEGNALDESGNYNGTASNVTYTTSSLGGRLASFNGSTSVITNTKTTNGAFSWSVWIVPNAIASSQIAVGTYYTGAIQWAIGCTGGNIRISTYDGVAKEKIVTGTNGTYYHCVLTFDGSAFRGFINGVEIGTAVACTTNTQTATMEIGRIYSSYYWNGYIDQLRVFNRALTAGEVSSLYTSENSII